ncbi:MAG: YraN family protein [Bacillota bacterium]|nr:YraN family protein [Bacillota bacterium]
MSFTNKESGDKGEAFAAEYLVQQGYTVLEKNYRYKYGEIDIIASKDKYIVFVEVKARRTNSLTQPAEAVTKQKQANIIRTAYYFLIERKIEAYARFDVIEVIFNPETLALKNINHIENAFIQGGPYASF